MKKINYFGTDGLRGRVGGNTINPEFMLKLGWAIGTILGKPGKVLIGKDTRISGYMLESALEAGLSAAGTDIHLLGPMPTPAIAYLTRTFRAQAGIVISASHNPYHDNGIKLFSAQGTKLADDVESAIEAQCHSKMVMADSDKLGKAIRIEDAPGRYIEFCKSTVDSGITLAGIKIVVDCANGATYHIAANVFRELGAEVVELNVNPDGFNINANCGATDPFVLKERVIADKADLGIALDGDGDRLIMIDHKGEIIDGDEILYIIAKDNIVRGRNIQGVIGTLMSNMGLEHALLALGVAFKRTHVGDRHIFMSLKENNWLLGGEPSGHIVNLEKTTTGDGIITALQVLAAMHHLGLCLHDLKGGVTKFPQTMINVKSLPNVTLDPSREPSIQRAMKTVKRRLGDCGRVLLRASGTEPVIRIMVEGKNKEQVSSMALELASVVQKAQNL